MEGILKTLKAGARLLTRRRITYNFPPETPLTEGFRGRHVFDPTKCIGCKLCYRICPNNAIEMVEREKDEGNVLQPQIDYARCSFCGLCVDICPMEALSFSNSPFLVALNKEDFNYPPERLAQPPEHKVGKPPKIKSVLDWARSRSLWIVNYFTGCCFIEAIPWIGSGFDMERFGLIAVGSPRHADVLLIGGYVTVKTLRRIIRIYQQMPNPKFVIAMGNCPMSGGTYWDSYNTIKMLDKYIPVDIWIAGCPPRPEALGLAVFMAIHAVQSGYRGKKESVKLLELPGMKGEEKEGWISAPFGPQHPASGNFNLLLKLNGEAVEKAEVNPGYLHRGFEKLMEYRMWWQNIMLVPRICVQDGASYELAYVGAVEKIADVEVPRRAQHLRVIQAELSRIQSHLLNLGLAGNAAGFDTVERLAWGDREKILRLLEELTGGRIYQIYNVPGGVRRDISSDFKDEAMEVSKYVRERLEIYDDLCFNNGIFIRRTKNIGKLAKKQAVELGVTGPNLRATGVEFDVRKAMPYEAYDEIDVNVITAKKGDAYSRILCRRNEIQESLNIVEQALDKMPNGPIAEKKTRSGKKLTPFSHLPNGETISSVESARGELCFHVISDGKHKPYRVKIKGPTFDSILVTMPRLLRATWMADIPVVYWSLDNCPADHDR